MSRKQVDGTSKTLKNLGARLRFHRKKAGLSLEEAARRSNVTVTELRAAERGGRNVSIETLLKLTAGLGVSLSRLALEVSEPSDGVQPALNGFVGEAVTRESLATMSEQTLRRVVLAPLFAAMAFDRVAETHGSILEQGKDFVLWGHDRLGAVECTGVVVKAGDITGSAESRPNTAGTVATQIQQCLRSAWPHPISHEPSPIHVCWVVASGEIKKEAELSIGSILGEEMKTRVRFIGREKLLALLEEYLGHRVGLGRIREGIALLETALPRGHQIVATAQASGAVTLAIHEDPSVAKRDPLTIGIKLSQPDTPEGRAAVASAVHKLKFGGRIDMKDGVLAGFTPPAVVAALLPAGESLSTFSIESRPKPLKSVVRLVSMHDEVVLSSLDGIVLNSVRTGEGTWRSYIDDDSEALRFELERKPENGILNFSWATDPGLFERVDVVRLETTSQFLESLRSANRFLIVDTRSEVVFLDTPIAFSGWDEPDPTLTEHLRLQAIVQRWLGRRLFLSGAALTPALINDILILGSLLDEGEFTHEAVNAHWTLELLPENALRLIESLDKSEGEVSVPVRKIFDLAGTRIQMEHYQRIRGVTVDAETRERLRLVAQVADATSRNEPATVDIVFVPREGRTFPVRLQLVRVTKTDLTATEPPHEPS